MEKHLLFSCLDQTLKIWNVPNQRHIPIPRVGDYVYLGDFIEYAKEAPNPFFKNKEFLVKKVLWVYGTTDVSIWVDLGVSE